MLTLLLGGARSGKSELAEAMASAAGDPVTYVATAARPVDDPDFEQRLEAHRRRRPPSWVTLEADLDLPAALVPLRHTVLVDSLGAWLARFPDFELAGLGDTLVEVLATHPGRLLVVSEEVGLGVHPSSRVGVEFRDALGTLNRAVAEVADEVLLVVAGCSLALKKAQA